jgi:hypothetical protein
MYKRISKLLLFVAKTCKTKSKPKWRYTKTSAPPNYAFMATGDSIQAWRAMGGLHMEPLPLFSLYIFISAGN